MKTKILYFTALLLLIFPVIFSQEDFGIIDVKSETGHNYGSLFIQSNPSGAYISLDGKSMGEQTPARIDMIPSGKHKITLTHDNFEPLESDVLVEDEKSTEVIFDLAAGFGTIGVWVEPQEAGIYVDGKKMGTGFYSGPQTAGKHIIEGILDKYHTESKELQINGGDESRTKFQLLPIQGNISVMVDPPETEITLDDKYTGLSPKIISQILVGTHEIVLSKKGYSTIKKTIEVTENQTVAVNDTLELGRLIRINSSCSGFDVIFDGIKKGITPVEIVAQDGKHLIQLKKKYYSNMDFEIYINPQQTDFILSPKRDTTLFSIKTEPKAANYQFILNDPDFKNINSRGPLSGQYSGKTPDALTIKEGQYQLLLSKKGYKNQDATLEITGDKAEKFIFLEPQKFRTKSNALLLSAFWPGAGQSYIKRGSPHFLMGVAAYGCAGFALERYVNALNIEDEYKNEQDGQQRTDLKNSYDNSMQMSQYLQIGALAIWGINMIWTAIMPSEKISYNRLKIQALGYPDSKSIGIGLIAGF
jgi:hypothetical protein